MPVGVMLSIARSRLAVASQFVFLIVNAFALLLGLIYNYKTPDLYENNAHGKIGWTVTWIASAWVVMSVIDAYATRAHPASPRKAVHDLNAANMAQYQRVQDSQTPPAPRWSNDSGQGTERNSASLYGHSRSPSVESEQERFLDSAHGCPNDNEGDISEDPEKIDFLRGTAVDRLLSRHVARFAIGKPLRILRLLSVFIERTILVQGFVGITSGTIVYGGIGVSAARVPGH